MRTQAFLRSNRKRMLKWLKDKLGLSFGPLPTPDQKLYLELKRETQALRQNLEEQQQKLLLLRDEVERQQAKEEARVAEFIQAFLEKLMTEVAAPVAQLLTQARRVEIEGQPVATKEVLTAAKRLVRTFEQTGLTWEGTVGATVSFDPERHEPLSSATPTVGQPVVVRVVGVAYRGKLLCKAGVEKD